MTALQLLQELDFQHKRKQYPNLPDHAIPRGKYSDKTANGLTRAILAWLALHGHYATRVTTTGRQLKGATMVDVIGRTRTFNGKWIPGTTRTGTADIHASIKDQTGIGRHCSIEVKVGKDRMSESQERTKQDVEDAGGVYFIAKDFESFMLWYKELTQSSLAQKVGSSPPQTI